MNTLTSSQQDYLKVIYKEIAKNHSATTTKIADILGVSKPSVNSALNTLAHKGFINYAPYSKITLTKEGHFAALEILTKYNVMVRFFIDVLKLDEKESLEISCKMEHIISDKILQKIGKFYKISIEHYKNNKEYQKILDEI